MSSPRHDALQGALTIFPLVLGAAPFGLIFGALAIKSGLDLWQTLGMSLFVFAGSAQFVAVTLLSGGAAWAVILGSTLVINLRHVLYSASVQDGVRSWPRRWRLLLAYLLTDELFAVLAPQLATRTPDSARRFMAGAGVLMLGSWLVTTLLGALLGQHLPQLGEWGLEFAMVATFGAIVVMQLTQWPLIACALSAGASALLLQGLPYKLDLLLATLIAIATGLACELRRPQLAAQGENA